MTESTRPKTFCFILMPFTEDFDDIYKLGIKQSCLDAGTYCERVDEQIYQESILDRIYNQISKADIIIADMTGRNPNVFYEVGYAHALGKPTILLTSQSEDIPFDLKHYPHIIYGKKISTLKVELTKKLNWFLQNLETGSKNYKLDIDMYCNSINISTEKVVLEQHTTTWQKFTITIQNNTFSTLYPTDYKIGILTNENYISADDSKTATLPDGNRLHMLGTPVDILYPTSFTSFSVKLNDNGKFEEQIIFVRLFTAIGTRDYPLTLKWK